MPLRIVVIVWTVLLLLLIAVVVLLDIREGNAVADPPWKASLRDFGYSHVTAPTEEAVNRSESISVSLPEGSQQGLENWWLLYTHFNIEFDPSSGPGTVWISAAINDHPAMELEITVPHYVDGYLVSRSEVINGPSQMFTLAPTQTYGIANYLPLNGVTSGRNDLVFQLRRTGDVRVERLVFFDDTQFIRIPLAPPKLELRTSFGRMELVDGSEVPTVGSAFPLSVYASRSGSGPRWPVKSIGSVVIEVIDPDDAFLVERALEGQWRYLLTPLKAGAHSLVFSAPTRNAGTSQVRFDTIVYEPGEGPPGSWQKYGIGAIAVGLTFAGAVLILWLYRRKFTKPIAVIRTNTSNEMWERHQGPEAVIAAILLALTTGYVSGLFAVDRSIPDFPASVILGGTLENLFLFPFLIGLLFRPSLMGVIPILGSAAGVFLWYLLAEARISDIGYDTEWWFLLTIWFIGFSFLTYLTFLLGRGLRKLVASRRSSQS